MERFRVVPDAGLVLHILHSYSDRHIGSYHLTLEHNVPANGENIIHDGVDYRVLSVKWLMLPTGQEVNLFVCKEPWWEDTEGRDDE